MTTPESRDYERIRFEHAIPEDKEEIGFKCNLMKIIEDLKQDVKYSFKETEKTKR